MVLIRKRKLKTTSVHYTGKRKPTTRTRSLTYRFLNAENDLFAPFGQPSTSSVRQLAVDCHTEERIPSEENVLVQEEAAACKSRYDTLKEGSLQDWKFLRDDLYNTLIKSEAPSSDECESCGDECIQFYRCTDCANWEVICQGCLLQRHQQPHLHVFEAFWNGTFVGTNLDTPTWRIRGHGCSTTYLKSMVIVNDKGRQHIRTLQFCKLKGFCEALKVRCSKHHKNYTNLQIKDIYKVLTSETFSEFRHFFHRIEQPNNLCKNLDDGTNCPACFSTEPKIYSFDADFQSVRKTSAGKQWEQPKHQENFFLNQIDVDEFIGNYSTDKKKQNDCSEFQAGTNLRSKNKTKKLTETAVFGSTCRHEFPKYFFSLKHGERLGYSVFLLKKLLEDEGSSSENPYQIHIVYDIACSLHNHLKKQADSSLLEKVKFSIPIFHSYGHKMDCQILYSPRRTNGVGLTDGERLERLWSYLGRFSKITKEMTPENRVDLLTNALLHYGRKIKDKLGQILPGKLKKAVHLESTSSASLQELLKQLPGVSFDIIERWISEEEKVALSSKNDQNVALTLTEEYCMKLEEELNMRESLTDEQIAKDTTYKKITSTVQKMEKRLKVRWNKTNKNYNKNLSTAKEKRRMSVLVKLQRNSAERHFLLNLIRKYARGQAIAIRLSKQVKHVASKIKQSLEEYNSIGKPTSTLPLVLSFEEIKNHESVFSTIWSHIWQSSLITYPLQLRDSQHIYCQ